MARIALKSNIASEVAHIDLSCGGGRGSVRFGTISHAEGVLRLEPAVGDVLRISVFRNRAACQDEFAATNTKTGTTQKVTVSTACDVIYRHAVLGADLVEPAVSPPSVNTRLWVFRNTAITSYNGTHGTICGPWPTAKHLAAPVVAVRMFPSSPWNHCRNFGIWLKGTS